MEIKIIPLKGIIVDGKNIDLGMHKSEVAKKLGEGELESRHFFFNYDLAIDYDGNECVEFIEFLGGIDGSLSPCIYDIPVFESNSADIYELLKKKNNGEIDDSENGYSYAFLNTSIGVYRDATEQSVKEDIECMKADGVYDQEYVDEQMMKANRWTTIGIGVKDYYCM